MKGEKLRRHCSCEGDIKTEAAALTSAGLSCYWRVSAVPIYLHQYDSHCIGVFLLASRRGCLSLLSLPEQNTRDWLGGLNNRKVFLTVLEAGRLRSGCQHVQVSVRALNPALQTTAFSLRPHMAFPKCLHVERERKKALWCVFSLGH